MHHSTHLAQYLPVSALIHEQQKKNQVRSKGHCLRVRAPLQSAYRFYSCALVSLVQPELEKAR